MAERLNRVNQGLMRKLESALYGAIKPASVEAAAQPQVQMYGVMQPAYAASLGQTGNGILDPLNQMALRNGAEQEREAYSAALIAAHKGELESANNKAYNDMQASLVTARGTDAQTGMAGAYGVIRNQDGTPTLVTDPVNAMVNNDLHINTEVAGARAKNAGAISDLYKSGIQTSPEVTGGYMRSPTQVEPDKYGVFNTSGVSASDATDQFKAESDRIDVNNPRKYAKSGGSGGGSEPTITIIPGMFGMPPQTTIKGKASQMQQYMGGAAPTVAAAPTGLAGVIARAKAIGANVQQQGTNVVISKGASKRVYDANGNQVQ